MRTQTCLTARWLRRSLRNLAALSCAALALEMIPVCARGAARPAGAAKADSLLAGPNFPGKRDPFKLPVDALPRPAGAGKGLSVPVHLPPGPRGLTVSQLQLKGIVSDDREHEMIAVVSQNNGGAYFLRKNEELYDGVVTEITARAVYFRERIPDPHGREVYRVVVKQLNSTGEGQ